MESIGNSLKLDDQITVELITGYICQYCSWPIQSQYHQCYICKQQSPSFKRVIALGYYIPKWYNLPNAFIRESNGYPTLDDVNPKYRFSKLINDAKARCEYRSEKEKEGYIEILCRGLSWVIKKEFPKIFTTMDYMIHIPKIGEARGNLFNHGYYYAKYLAEMLGKEFRTDIIKEINTRVKNDVERFEITCSPSEIKGKCILIVDDVYTKGKTKRPLSDLLKNAGAEYVYICVAGRSCPINICRNREASSLQDRSSR